MDVRGHRSEAGISRCYFAVELDVHESQVSPRLILPRPPPPSISTPNWFVHQNWETTMPHPRTQLVVTALGPPLTVFRLPIDSIEWGRDSSTGKWHIQISALRPPPLTTQFGLIIKNDDQTALSNFHDKILSCIGNTTLQLVVDIHRPDLPNIPVFTVDFDTSNARLLAPAQIATLGL